MSGWLKKGKRCLFWGQLFCAESVPGGLVGWVLLHWVRPVPVPSCFTASGDRGSIRLTLVAQWLSEEVPEL
ncbi:hypothetical protein AS29_010225 [Bacillus sp. SJS]|nr:hypothetical protein AS29_010225 [Bacillus sp. SJS]